MSKPQLDPRPPSQPVQDEPSLLIYIGLFVAAVLMIVIAFISQPDVEGLLLNLATELLGALIILAIVERRLRDKDAKSIQDLLFAFTLDRRTTIKYANVLQRQILNINPVSRPEFDDLLQKYPSGFVLCGLGGSGKSTLVQKLTVDQCAKTIQSPRTEKIPVFALIREWDMQISLEEYLRSVAQQYFVIKDKIYDEWFQNGRLMIVLDGLDECEDIPLALDAVRQMCAQKLGNSIIVVSRRTEDVCGLPIVNISGMTTRQSLEMFSETLPQATIETIGEQLLHQLAEKLDGHPLAMRIATGLIKNSDHPTDVINKILSELDDTL